jgi:hypothetical protein
MHWSGIVFIQSHRWQWWYRNGINIRWSGGYVGQSPLNFAGGTVYFRLPGEASVTIASGVYSGQAVLSGSSSTAGTLYHVTGTFSATDVNTGKVVTGSTDTVVGIKGHSGRGGGITFTLVTGQITLDPTNKYGTSIAINCAPQSFLLGMSTTCTATVSGGSSPGGDVTFLQSGGTGSVSFPNPATCTLASGSCSLTLVGTSPGNPVIQAAYSGDTNNLASSRTLSLAVMAIPTTTDISCTPLSIALGAATTCTATIKGLSPTGIVSWSSSSATGIFSSSDCTLSANSCQVSYNDTTSGAAVIVASYSGDSNNLWSSNSTIVGNFDPAATAAASSSTAVGTPEDRLASANQAGTTGIRTSISGISSEDGTLVIIFSADLPTLPSGTPSASLTGLGFYYLEVYGIFDGTARVCISNPLVDSGTQFLVPGASICGDIPVVYLTGTPIAIGD